MGREIKKSLVIGQKQQTDNKEHETKKEERNHSRSRSRERQKKEVVVEKVDASSRRAMLMRMRQKEEEEMKNKQEQTQEIKIEMQQEHEQQQQQQFRHRSIPQPQPQLESQPQQQDHDEDGQVINRKVLLKPVYVQKDVRDTVRQRQEEDQRRMQEEERKHKINRLNTKLILNETMKGQGEEAEEDDDSDSDRASLPDDSDTKDPALEYEMWKIRQLKRIRRDREQRQKYVMQQAEVQRRSKLTDQQRLLQNKRLGSDLTDHTQSTKYVFMQKYYHKGAFYQDNEDQIFKRDYNLPTPMELQDKSMLPKILQKRKNDFGRKGQSKYQHLTAEDTTDFDPKHRPDEAIRINMQRKMAGYKGSFMK